MKKVLEKEKNKYSIDITTDDANYAITGEIEEEDFIKIVEGIYIN